MFVDETPELEDLLRLGRVVAWIERPSDDQKADLAAKVGPAEEEERERAQQDVDPLDLLDPPDEEDQALAEAMAQVLTDSRLRLHLAHGARERAEQFTWQRVGDRIIDLYDRILARRAVRT